MNTGTLVAGKYRVERVIGRGGMGYVVEATHVHLQSKVAVKFLSEEMVKEPVALARFTREARATAQLKGEHICRVSDFGVENNTPYLVMELLSGTDLARLLKVRTLDFATAALYIKQACAGLAEAHAVGIIHRDLKPGNLFLTRRADGSPIIKVLDFGVAKAPKGSDEVGLTGTSNVVGSPGFMSPEQFRSSRSVDARTDVWSLGIILFKLVSGELPFKGDGFAEYALAIAREKTPRLPDVPEEFQAVVNRCLEKDAARRFPDVASLGEALAPFAATAKSSAPAVAGNSRPAINLPPPEPPPNPAGTAPGPGVVVPVSAAPGGKPRAAVGGPAQPKPQTPNAAKATILGTAERRPTAAATPNALAAAIEAKVAAVAAAGPGAAGPIFTNAATVAGSGSHRLPPVDASELAPGTVVGEYRIEAKIGEGGMGVVYSAIHPLIGKKAAIKVISAELGADLVVIERFIQEARSVNQIGHPNIVDVFAFGNLPDGRNYFVMEHLQGESLRGRLNRSFVRLAEGLQILDEIASALEAAHEKHIVHRDLKPDNVFLSAVRGNIIMVKLLDFGIAKLTGESTGIHKTHTGEMVGTPAYLSPEQARGRNVDYRTDIYALGCMTYEVVTGRIPFIAESAMDVVRMHIQTLPVPPSQLVPELPPQLDRLILQMLDKQPEKRPSLEEIRTVFADLVTNGAVPIEPGTGMTFRSDLSRRREATPPSSQRNQILANATQSQRNEILNPATSGKFTQILGGAGGPMPQSPVPALAPPAASTERRRANSISEAPTRITFEPGPEAISPLATTAMPMPQVPEVPKKRSKVAFLVIALALLIPAAGIAIAMISRDPQAADATAGSQAPTNAAATMDAAVMAAAPVDAGAATTASPGDAAAATHEVIVRVNVPTATIEIDGARVASSAGVARVPLREGPHVLVASAPGRVAVNKTFEVSAKPGIVEIKLERERRGHGKTQPAQSGSAATTTTTTPVRPTPGTTAGSGSARSKHSDDTVDPFAQ